MWMIFKWGLLWGLFMGLHEETRWATEKLMKEAKRQEQDG